MRKGRYYLGRVIKINLNQEQLMNAIANAPIVSIGKFDWTITDVIDNRNSSHKYVFGKLSKYAKDGSAKVIDEQKRSQVKADIPNLLEASSPFIYLPDYSGIAFLHVWNGIQEDVFPRRFKSIIEAAYDNFFVGCEIEPVSDYRAFTSKLKKLEKFTEISATVYPPNPLFGRLWGNLNSYIKARNASEITVKEHTEKNEGLKSDVVEHLTKIMKDPHYEPEKIPDIGDAALLMAADGYGRGKVIGIEDGDEVIIKTSDTQKSFLFSQEPAARELSARTEIEFKTISHERDMSH